MDELEKVSGGEMPESWHTFQNFCWKMSAKYGDDWQRKCTKEERDTNIRLREIMNREIPH